MSNITEPTLTVVRPADGRSNGTSVIVCPGGGFQFLSWSAEGTEVGDFLAKKGITAFILKYRVRLGGDAGSPVSEKKTFEDHLKAGEAKIDIARADAVQSIRYLRDHAEELGIKPNRIGLMGFSAGAMTTLSTLLKAPKEDRPNFAASIYGAMEDVRVPGDVTPLFIVHTQEDAMVPAVQATKVFNAWTEMKREAELHLYQKGEHGFGMRTLNLPVDGWKDAFATWLESKGLLKL